MIRGESVLVLVVLAIGFSRIALGVHYLCDVVAGKVLGAAWMSAMAALFNALRIEHGRLPVDVKEGLEPEQGPRLSGTTSGNEKPETRSREAAGSDPVTPKHADTAYSTLACGSRGSASGAPT